MAEALIFVDDFVTGRLPAVCAVTGHETTDQVKIKANVSPTSPIWILLVFLGPLGWIVLLLGLWSSSSQLTGWIPYSHREALRRRARRRQVLIRGGLGIAGLLLSAAGLKAGLLVGLAVATLVAGLVWLFVQEQQEPHIGLDASRRWVTVGRIHPNFARAVARSSGDTDRAASV